MKIANKHSKLSLRNLHRSKVFLSLVAILLISGATYAYWYDSQSQDSTPVEAAPAELSEEDAKSKEEFIEANEDSIKKGSDEPTKRGGIVESSAISVTATQQNNDIVVQTKLTNTSSGMCTLRVSNGANSIEREAEIIYQAEYSTCAGFSVAKSDLGAGTWQINIEARSGSLTKTASTILEVK